MRRRTPILVVVALAFLVFAAKAHAIRPFVTDDARVVGHKLVQLETWVLIDGRVIEHYALPAFGPTDWLELTAGVLQGGVHAGQGQGYSITGPFFQAKALVLAAQNNRAPGVAIAGGVLPAVGHGAFTPLGVGGFGYLALTETIAEEALLFHANLGFSVANHPLGDATVTGGIATQIRVVGGLHALGEVYYGDPYDAAFRLPAGQMGVRYIFSDHVQMDGTVGSTLDTTRNDTGHAQNEQWGTLGVRLVTSELW